MTAGLGAWWCFMGYQKAPLRTDKITRTLLALLWSGKQRHVSQPGLAGNSGCGTALVLVHLPCYAWVEAGVTLPLISFSSFEILFMAHLIITQYIFSVLFDTREPCHRYRCCDRRQKTAFGFKIWNMTRYVSCTGNTRVVLCGGADPFVICLSYGWIVLTSGRSLPLQQKQKTTMHTSGQFVKCHTLLTLQFFTHQFVN